MLSDFLAYIPTHKTKTAMPPTVLGILFHYKDCIVFALLKTLICFVCAWTRDKDSIKEIKLFP